MVAVSEARSDAIVIQLESLRRERMSYVTRVAGLMRRSGCEAETQGYLSLIENINEACIRLAGNSQRDQFSADLGKRACQQIDGSSPDGKQFSAQYGHSLVRTG